MPDIFQIGADLGEMAKTIASAEDKIRLSTAAMALNQLAEENSRLMKDNEHLRTELARRKALEYRDGSYYVVTSDGKEAGPLCPRCYQDEGFIYLLSQSRNGARCSVCGKTYAGSKWAVGSSSQGVR